MKPKTRTLQVMVGPHEYEETGGNVGLCDVCGLDEGHEVHTKRVHPKHGPESRGAYKMRQDEAIVGSDEFSEALATAALEKANKCNACGKPPLLTANGYCWTCCSYAPMTEFRAFVGIAGAISGAWWAFGPGAALLTACVYLWNPGKDGSRRARR